MKHLNNATVCIQCGNQLAASYHVNDGGFLEPTAIPAIGIACIEVVLECGWCGTEYGAFVPLERFAIVEHVPGIVEVAA